MANRKSISVTVVYALTHHQEAVTVELSANSTVEQAIIESGILRRYSEIDITKNSFGIYGEVVKNSHILHHQDRVEIYRPLTVDPMHARRKRAEMQSKLL